MLFYAHEHTLKLQSLRRIEDYLDVANVLHRSPEPDFRTRVSRTISSPEGGKHAQI